MRFAAAVLLALGATACATPAADNPTGNPPAGGGAQLILVNGAGSSGAVAVYMDGQALSTAVAAGQMSAALAVSSGTHAIEVRATGAASGISRSVSFGDGKRMLAIAVDSAGLLVPALVDDSNSVVPAGASKLRVVHMAANAAPIDIWRTQPDYSTPIRVQFPFDYRDASPYLQSTPGDWRVMISDPVTGGGNPAMPDTLANSGVITVPAGTSRTVVVLDRPGGGVMLVTIDP